ncbi:MAG: methyltransferase domain-containing protein [Gammaproteobacteria bacterium]
MQTSANDKLSTILRQMNGWYQETLGAELLSAERQQLDLCLPQFYGRHLLQVGGPGGSFLFEQSPIWHSIRLSPEFDATFRGPVVQGSFEQWPFLPGCFNVILMPHVLEIALNPIQVLQQAYQALAPGGHLLILGFNPLSLWGLKQKILPSNQAPWSQHFYTCHTVCGWLKKQEFLIKQETSLFFRPPLKNKYGLDKLFILEPIGKLLGEGLGGVYFIIAEKCQIPLTPLPHKIKPLVGQLKPTGA